VISRAGPPVHRARARDEPAYFREEILFAFEESIPVRERSGAREERGRLHLVHCAAAASCSWWTHGTPKAVDVHKGEPLRIPMEQLVGWHGPRSSRGLVSIVEEAPELGTALELAAKGARSSTSSQVVEMTRRERLRDELLNAPI